MAVLRSYRLRSSHLVIKDFFNFTVSDISVVVVCLYDCHQGSVEGIRIQSTTAPVIIVHTSPGLASISSELSILRVAESTVYDILTVRVLPLTVLIVSSSNMVLFVIWQEQI